MIGKTLGHYKVLEPLGAGGMGEVYRARDTKLGRDVAIKVLPDEVATDSDRLARFEREAKLLASLNHSNIAAIYGLEDEGDTRFIAMELVEGATLAERLRAKGPLDLDEALDIAGQIAAGLEAAHESGVIHRDLKPANVIVTGGGEAKVLDFGLAKAFEADPPGPAAADEVSNSPTMAAATMAGAIMGTAAYMSPEQARGKPVDRRTDIWSFGCVLYEMLTGRAPFPGDTVTDILAAVVKDEPDNSLLPAATPGNVRHLLHRCQAKDPRQRLQHIGDARVEVGDPRRGAAAPAAAQDADRRYGVASLALVGLGAAALAAVAVWFGTTAATPPMSATARFSFDVPDGLRIMSDDPQQDGPWHPYVPFALSPDGSKLAYLAVSSDAAAGGRQLYLRTQDVLSAQPLPGTTDAHMPFFSPDGASIGFWANGTLYRISVGGGPPVRIAEISLRPRGATWAPDDTIILGGVNRGMSMVNAAGGDPVEITTTDTDRGDHYHAWPSMLPGGDEVLFTVVAETADDVLGIYSMRDNSYRILERPRAVTQGHYLDSGHLVFFRSGSLFAAPFDPRARSSVDNEVPVTQVATGWSAGMFFGLFAVAANGTLVHARPEDVPSENTIVFVDEHGGQEPIPGLSSGGYTYRPSMSPDGTRLVVSNITSRGPSSDLWVYGLESGTQQRLTNQNANIWPLWSIDGSEVYFARYAATTFDIAVQRSADDQAAPMVLVEAPGDDTPSDLSLDGRWLAHTRRAQAGGLDIWVTSLEGQPTPREWLATPANETEAAISPDGRHIAYTSDVTGKREVYVRPFSGEGRVITVSVNGGRSARWSTNGTELFFLREHECLYCDDAMMAASFELDPELRTLGAPRLLFEGRYDPFFDIVRAGPRFVSGSARFVMLPRVPRDLSRLVWVLDWATEVDERVPGG